MKKIGKKELEQLQADGAIVTRKPAQRMGKTHQRAAKQPDPTQVIVKYMDGMKIALVQAVTGNGASMSAAIEKLNIKPPEITIHTAPAIKSIHVTDIKRDMHGRIEEMDMNIEREQVH